MKKPISIVAVLLFLFFGAADMSGQSLPKRYTKNKDRLFFTVAHPIMLHMPEDYSTTWYANEFNLQFFLEWRFGEGPFSLGYGVGYNSINFHNNLRIESDPQTGRELYSIIADSTNFRRNKLNTKFIEIPLELRFRPKLNNGYTLKIYAGGKVGYQIESYARFGDEHIKFDDFRLDDVNQWNYGIYLRLGYRFMSLYGYYGISPIFTGGDLNGQELNRGRQLSIGISFSG